MKTKEKKEVSKRDELFAQARKFKEEIFQLQLENMQKKLKNTSSLGIKKDELARLLTFARQVEVK